MRGVDKNPFSWYNTSVKRIREVNKMKNAKEIREITNKVLEERNGKEGGLRIPNKLNNKSV